MNLRLIMVLVVLFTIVSFAFCQDPDSSKDYGSKIVKAIKDQDIQKLSSFFDTEVSIHDSETNESILEEDDYDGFLEKKGVLYDIFFDNNKVKEYFEDDDVISFQKAYSESKEIYINLEEDIPQIKAFIDDTYYIIFLGKENRKINALEIWSKE